MNNKQKLITSGANLWNCLINSGTTLIDMTVDGTTLLVEAAPASVEALKETACIGFEVASARIQESEGVTRAEADKRAYKYANQPLAQTIQEASRAAGTAIAKAEAEWALEEFNEDHEDALLIDAAVNEAAEEAAKEKASK